MTDARSNEPKMIRRGIYLLPSLFTVAGLFSGFYSIVAATKGLFLVAAMWLFVAMVCDGLDGRVARLTNSQTEFGSQLDSMSDMVCFGLAPALLMYLWSLFSLGKIGWLSAFWYAVCAALRLARFNAMSEQDDKRYFKGVSSPVAAAFVASFVWTFGRYNFHGGYMPILMAVFMIIVGLLMVSSIPYRSFKDIDLRGNVPFVVIMLVVVVIACIILDPPKMLLIASSLYLFSGVVGYLWRYFSLPNLLHKIRKIKSKGDNN